MVDKEPKYGSPTYVELVEPKVNTPTILPHMVFQSFPTNPLPIPKMMGIIFLLKPRVRCSQHIFHKRVTESKRSE
jgi:hypothetical protein